MKHLLGTGLVILALGMASHGLETRTFTARDFASWSYPKGLVVVQPEGIKVKRFGKSYNAVADRDEYEGIVIGEHGKTKLRTPSNEKEVGLLADQNPNTWWKPAAADPLGKWWVEIDLGRVVAAHTLRVIFPDTVGARPFAFFSVFVSPGIPLMTSPEQVYFSRVGRPINNNKQRVVEFELRTYDAAVATGQYLVTKDTLDFDLVRFVRFEAAGRTPDAAIAEIEVETVGFNLATKVTTEDRLKKGLEVWGGRAWTSTDRNCPNCGKGVAPEGIIDGDLHGRYWAIESAGAPDWRAWGQWWGVDLGSVFRIDRIIWLPLVVGECPYLYGWDRERHSPWNEFDFLLSDGTPSNTADREVEGPYLYDLLSHVNNRNSPKRWLFDYQFPSRVVRFVFWRMMSLNEGSWGRASQVFIYHSEGFPAQVQIESEDLDLGSAFSIRRVEWDADLPPDTRIEVQTQTGNGFQSITRYFLSNGQEVTKEQYEAAKPRQKGPIVQDTVRDPSWSEWSLPHRFNGQDFLSPTPRRWLRTRVKLISDNPEAMPSLRSLSFVMNTPVISGGLIGEILPREAALDTLQAFRYLIRPIRTTPGDVGFDQVLIMVPPQAGKAELLSARVGGREVPATYEFSGDSLLVQLPPPAVKGDSVEIAFQTRLYKSPTVFEAFVLNSAQPDNSQGIVPSALGMNEVYVPQVVQAVSLFQNLAYSRAFTPNGDGINDLFQLACTVVKTDRQPRVRIFALDGTLLAELVNATPASGRSHYTWDGRDQEGELVPPGIYIAHLSIDADAKDEIVQKLVHVIY